MKFFAAVLILSGMIIGVGMFGIPFSFVKAGFWLGALELILVTGIILTLHLSYGNLVLATERFHRLPGYVKLYLGRRAELVAWFSAFFGIIGTLLAYIILGSTFFVSLFPRMFLGKELVAAIIFTVFGALVIFFSFRKEAVLNGILTALLMLFALILAVFLIPAIRPENLLGFNLKNAPVPYGVLLFALAGTVVIPDLVTFLNRDRFKSRLAICIGTLLPAFLYFVFALAVVGVSGAATSEEAIEGLLPFAGAKIVILGSLIGLLAVFTSFITLGKSLQALLVLDFGFSKTAAWGFSVGTPFLFYLLGFQSFISIIGAVGALAVGLDALLVLFSYRELLRRREIYPKFIFLLWRIILYVIIGSGVVYEFFKFIV